MKRGEIYWVNLDPTVGAEIKKRRPALVVSNDVNNQYSPLVTILPITSKVAKAYPFEVVLAAGAGGLEKESLIKANQIRTVDKGRLVGGPLGHALDAGTMAQVDDAIRVHLALGD